MTLSSLMKESKIISQNSFPIISYILLGLIALYVLGYFIFIKPFDTKYSSFDSSPILNLSKVSPGYTLIAPYNRIANANPNFKGKIYLLDLLGNPVHTWTVDKQPLYSQLRKNGNLLVVMEAPSYSHPLPPGGNTGTIEELDWNSKVVWKYQNEAMHHDFVDLPNGNILIALWEKTPNQIASTIQGGTPNTTLNDSVFSDNIVEINRQGKIVWSWHAYDHLDPAKDVIGDLMPQFAWTYTNGLVYTPHNPIDGSEAFVISMRSLSEVIMVRKSDGQILWRSPKDMFNNQHDPTVLPNGNIMVFDNSFTRAPNPFPSYGSRVVEVNPKTNQIAWQFDGGAGVIDKIRFFAPIVGGAQRLPNGNTLITDGPKGHIFEVTKDKKVVWDLVSPYTTQQTGEFPNNFLFKSRRILADQINWPVKLPPVLNKTSFVLYALLKPIYNY
ncbi:aryl-sulfate sulfotransferase [soil metagenome]